MDGPGTGAVVEVVNPAGGGDFVLVCEHASNFIPAEYRGLGLDDETLLSHIAWDPGALAVAEAMSRLLDAPLVVQRVSRLLYDCNRPPEAPSSVPAVSEVHAVPGNAGLVAADREARAAAFYRPFHDALAALLDRRVAEGRTRALATVHTFTPVYFGRRRDVGVGILHDADARLADAMLARAAGMSRRDVRRNEPYGPADGVTHTLATHGVPRGLANVMIEIRSDLVASAASQAAMADWLAGLATAALGDVAERAAAGRPAMTGAG